MHKIPFLIFSWRLLSFDMIFAIWLSLLKHASSIVCPFYALSHSHSLLTTLLLCAILFRFCKFCARYLLLLSNFYEFFSMYVHSFSLIIFDYRSNFFRCRTVFSFSLFLIFAFNEPLLLFLRWLILFRPLHHLPNFSLGFIVVCIMPIKKMLDIHKFNFSEIVIIIVV